MQRLVKNFSWIACRSCADHWDELLSNWKAKSISAPILTLYSSKDVFTNVDKYEALIKEWKMKQPITTAIKFETSDHVKHLTKYPSIYKYNFSKFLSNLKM